MGNTQFITNVSYADILRGYFPNTEEEVVLISIVDPDMNNPPYCLKYAEVFKFKFLDLDVEDGSKSISDDQAEEITRVLAEAYDSGKSVVVHCVMGVCRSGAVVEAGEMLGFYDLNPRRQRSPNLLVKRKLFAALDKYL